jgi:hypothetical protein
MTSDESKKLLKRVDPATISPGPILREHLTDKQLELARAIFAVVYPYFDSFDAFELGFRRDIDPDSELRIWTGIAMAYQRFNEVYESSTTEERKAAFTSCVLLMSAEEDPPIDVPLQIWERCKQIIAVLTGPR